jgi:hypothetical protein
MRATGQPTPAVTQYADVNAALAELTAQIHMLLGAHCLGIYLSGSLALGDFDPKSSDIDLVIVTTGVLAEAKIADLRAMHASFVRDFAGGTSPWAGKVEAVYVARDALRRPFPNPTAYPQVEKGRGLFVDQLEDGWLSQCYIVREHGITLYGPDPKTIFDPVAADALRRTVARIAQMWQREARNDPTWIEWLRVRSNQAFVTLTLCRLLYTLATGSVASKPAAARWAQSTLPACWTELVASSPTGQSDHAMVPDFEVEDTIALVEFTVEKFRLYSP